MPILNLLAILMSLVGNSVNAQHEYAEWLCGSRDARPYYTGFPSGEVEPPPHIVCGPLQYHSPSKRFALVVSPVAGIGPSADYEMRDGEELLWASRKPYCLRGVVVTDTGRSLGIDYSYDQTNKEEDEYALLHVAILDAQGKESLHERFVRRSNRRFRTEPPSPKEPWVNQIILNNANEQAVMVMTPNSYGNSLWLYDLSNGEFIGRLNAPKRFRSSKPEWVVQVRPIQQAPFTLVHWRWSTRNDGALALIDGGGRFVWSLGLPYECAELLPVNARPSIDEAEHWEFKLERSVPTGFRISTPRTSKTIDCLVAHDDENRPTVRCTATERPTKGE